MILRYFDIDKCVTINVFKVLLGLKSSCEVRDAQSIFGVTFAGSWTSSVVKKIMKNESVSIPGWWLITKGEDGRGPVQLLSVWSSSLVI